ncbi:ion channel [Leeuwenhoekiella nanhaiensis]|uniref:ion channel n=1 Tax=Leeuwenhoekiella nanhaiensis TaxID=1655491 RepID=UPI001CB9A61A|nr:ion channel [Leeuwenhoekiella nanhaiensis]
MEKIDSFYKQLFGKAWLTISVVIAAGLINIVLFSRLDNSWSEYVILALSIVKIYFIVKLSFNQLMKIIAQSHLMSHILVLFALLIGLILLSFATDYAALHIFDETNFKNSSGLVSSTSEILFEYLYLSTITFSSVGYGDIVPVSMVAKTLVMLQVALRFFVLVFGIANINNIKIEKYE